MKMCFYRREATDQKFDPEWIESQCEFKPIYLKGVTLGRPSRKLCFGICRMIWREKPELVIVPEFQFPMWQALFARLFMRRKFRLVSMCDDSIDMILDDNDYSWIHRMLRNRVPRLLDDIIVLTKDVQEWYRNHFGKGIWLPIMMDEKKALPYYKSVLPVSTSYLDEFDLSGKKIILFVGRLVKLKRVDLLISAYGKMKSEDGVLVIVGDGEERESLEGLARECPRRVVFTGRLEGDSLYAWYNIASVMVLLSSVEPFGAVTAEALIGGSKILISDKAGSACLVEGDNGFVTGIDDMDGIISKLDSILESVPVLGKRAEIRDSRMPFTFDECIERISTEYGINKNIKG